MKWLIVFSFLIISCHVSGQSADVVYDLVEQMPQFPGGEDSMRLYLLRHLQYPEFSKNHHIEGRVDVSFIVDENGNLSHLVVQKGQVPDINQEALRVVRSFPSFTPGIHGGKPAKVVVVIPIIFQLDDIKKQKSGSK